MKTLKRCTLFLSMITLASCYPQAGVIPSGSTRISIYVNNATGKVESVVKQKSECAVLEAGTYIMPPLPDISDLRDDQHVEIEDRLITHIELLRDELRRVTCVDTIRSKTQ